MEVTLPDCLKNVTGAQNLCDWFGYWPDFHDAEIISFHLNRTGPSVLSIHTWEMTSKVDDAGFYELVKHVVVDFFLDVSDEDDSLELKGLNRQNVISGLSIERLASGYKLTLYPCYGLAGTINTDDISIRLTPGKPHDRQGSESSEQSSR